MTTSSSGSSQAPVTEYVVRVPKTSKKRYHMMRFNSDLGSDFFKTWTQCKMERENNLKEFKMDEEIPKFGAGSEFGKEQREEARRKRFGINVKKYRQDDQPWMLSIGGKNGKKYKGIREGGVADNVSWYVFMQGKDGAFEAYPIDEWYNFQPINRYKALSAEEAEEKFVRRDKIMNYFQVMYEKKFRKENGEPEEEDGKKKSTKKSLMLSEMDEWFSDEDDESDREKEREEEDGVEKSSGRRKKKRPFGKKKKTGGKKQRGEGDDSDNSCVEESDEYNDGAEHDYISSDSSDPDQENEEVVAKELAGVEEGDALRKLLDSDQDDEDEEDKDKEEDQREKEEEDKEDKDKKKKKKKKKDKKSDKESDQSSLSSSDEMNNKVSSKSSDKKQAVNALKRKVKENPHEMPDAKKIKKMPAEAPGGQSSSGAASPPNDSMEEAIRRYLMRKPMTTTELLKNFKKKKDMSSEQLVTSIAQILKRVNPVKRMIKGKMYLSLRGS